MGFQVRRNRRGVDDRVAPFVERNALGKQFGAQPVPFALDPVDDELRRHGFVVMASSSWLRRHGSVVAVLPRSDLGVPARTAQPDLRGPANNHTTTSTGSSTLVTAAAARTGA